jgi:hypothetical protein
MVIFWSDITERKSKGDLGRLLEPPTARTGPTRSIVASTVTATVVVVGRDQSRPRLGQERFLVGQGQQRIPLRTAQPTPRMLAQEENDEREDEAETDRESEWDDGHSGGNGRNYFFTFETVDARTVEFRPGCWCGP